MKTYELLDEGGRLYAFEVNNTGLGRRGVCRVVETIPQAEIKRRPKFLSWFREEVFCEFEVEGETFVAWEPFGDNSRYWIGPEPTRFLPQTQIIKSAFDAVNASRVFRWLGILAGAFLVGSSLLMFSVVDGRAETFQSLIGVLLGAYFINFGLTGRRSFWVRK